MKSTQQQAGVEKCSIQTLSTQEPLSLQKVAFQHALSSISPVGKVLGLGKMGPLMSIFSSFK
jgi:hypothetical protein